MDPQLIAIDHPQDRRSPQGEKQMSAGLPDHKPRLGISQCLLGDTVRYDGGHKRDAFLTDVLAPFVEWIPVCPEVEAGLGTPREAMHLAGDPNAPRLLTIRTHIDHTITLKAFSQRRVQELQESDLDGYIFKKSSPSCGVHRVKVYTEKGQPSKQGTGIFSGAFQKAFPLLPVEEEGRLSDAAIRENFIERIFCYRRWKSLFQESRISRGGHCAIPYPPQIFIAHSQPFALSRPWTTRRQGRPIHTWRLSRSLRCPVHGCAQNQGHGAKTGECPAASDRAPQNAIEPD